MNGARNNLVEFFPGSRGVYLLDLDPRLRPYREVFEINSLSHESFLVSAFWKCIVNYLLRTK